MQEISASERGLGLKKTNGSTRWNNLT